MPAQFYLPELPFDPTALAPAISKETFDMHHGGHHKGYVDNLNKLADAQGFEKADLVTIIRKTADAPSDKVSQQVSGGIFANAAQHFNHAFYWQSLAADGGAPTGDLAAAIDASFGSVANLKEKLSSVGAGHFASGWVWLVAEGKALKVVATHDAQTPVSDNNARPLLVLDVWEHAYYIDHRRARKAYLDAVVAKHLNFAFAAKALAASSVADLSFGIDNKGA